MRVIQNIENQMNYDKTNRKINKIENITQQNIFKLINLKLDYNSISSNQLSQINKYEVFSSTGRVETDIYVPLPEDITIPITNMIQIFPYVEAEPAYEDKVHPYYLKFAVYSGIHMSGDTPKGVNIHLEIYFYPNAEEEFPINITIYLIGKSRRETDEIRRNKS